MACKRQKLDDDVRRAIFEAAACRAELIQKLGRQEILLSCISSNSITPDETIELRIISGCIAQINATIEGYVKIINEPPFIAMRFSSANEEFIRQVTGVETKSKLWAPQDYSSLISPSAKFKELFEENSRIFSGCTEAGRRSFLDMFFRDILARNEFGSTLRLFAELELSITSTNANAQTLTLSGIADYAIGRSRVDMLDKPAASEFQLVAVEAKCQLDRDSIWQCVAEAATLHKLKKDSSPGSCEIWGILSDAEIWTFMHIDNSSQLWMSKRHYLNIQPDQYNQSEIDTIYRMIYGIVMCCFKLP
jgi:hypothetical protein